MSQKKNSHHRVSLCPEKKNQNRFFYGTGIHSIFHNAETYINCQGGETDEWRSKVLKELIAQYTLLPEHDKLKFDNFIYDKYHADFCKRESASGKGLAAGTAIGLFMAFLSYQLSTRSNRDFVIHYVSGVVLYFVLALLLSYIGSKTAGSDGVVELYKELSAHKIKLQSEKSRQEASNKQERQDPELRLLAF